MMGDVGAPRPSFLDVDPTPLLLSSENRAISLLAGRDLAGQVSEDASSLWDLPQARSILARQRENGAWRYSGGEARLRTQRGYDQLETFR
jgi:hypothetical protein